MAGVSPRLISEVERGRRAHVSYETAMRLLELVGVRVTFDAQRANASDAARLRAEQRRQRWTGEQSTLVQQAPPPAPSSAVARLCAVARASHLADELRRAHRATGTVRSTTSPQ
jgi:transcriptional regulator with XRE-family HTH domain